MKIGICLNSKIGYIEQIECLKKVGVSRTFMPSEYSEFDDAIKYLKENGIECETVHAPFDKINDMWHEGKSGDMMLARLIDSVDKCEKYGIPVTIIHVSSGRPMTPISKIGDERYKKLVDYAKEKGVKVAFENLRYVENLSHNLKRYPEAGFCWDVGHEHCFTPGERIMHMFGGRLIALHIHDNACIIDSDDHLIPFDGDIDMKTVAKDIAKSGYTGTLMLEVVKATEYKGKPLYEDMTLEEYYKRAADAARKLADMVESYR